MDICCPHCKHHIDLLISSDSSASSCPVCGSKIDLLAETQSIRTSEAETSSGFELLTVVGVGHFGEVWKARDTKLKRIVALKFPHRGGDKHSTAAMLREAQAAAVLRHPHIVMVYDVVQEPDRVFIVSDFIAGVSLAEYLQAQRLTARQAAELCATVANALQHAHERGVVHRDLKPGNILLDADNKPYITDFGLAKQDGDVITITMEGHVLGTPAYMPPEQAAGKAHDADARSDIYSLGVILYELLAGTRPFRGGSKLLLHQVLHTDPPSIISKDRSVPRDLETICFKAMEKNPRSRYQTAAEMQADLERYLRGEPIHARPIASWERSARWMIRNPGWSTALAAGVLALVGGGALLFLRQSEASAFRKQTAGLTQQIASIATDRERIEQQKLEADRQLQRHPVAIVSEPPGARMIFYPITPGTGLPDGERRVEWQSAVGGTVLLRPGMYLIVAQLPDGDFHEVFRYIPAGDARDEIPFQYAHRYFRIEENGTVHLHPISIPLERKVTEEMAYIRGMQRYEVGQGSIQSAFAIPDFWIDRSEVTIAELRRIGVGAPIGYKPDHPDDYPATNLRLDDAISYAERAGKRLPPGVVFTYVATNFGSTRFPWGDEEPPAPSWEVLPVGSAEFDELRIAPVVRGLFSNAREFVCSAPATMLVNRADHFALGTSSVTVTGGPDPRKPAETTWVQLAADQRFSLPATTAHPSIGFRCIRWAQPGLTADSQFRILPKQP